MAAAMASIELRGHKELIRALNALPVKLEQKVLKKTLRKAINLYRSAARAHAPVRTGRHKKNIKTKAIKRRGRNRNQIGFRVSTGTREQLGIPADAKGYYPSAIEYGWTDQYGHRHPPQAHLRPAWASTKPKIEAAVVSGLRQGLAAVTREVAGRSAA